jgi:hypothetical protein
MTMRVLDRLTMEQNYDSESARKNRTMTDRVLDRLNMEQNYDSESARQANHGTEL